MDAPSQRSASQFTPYLSANQQDLLVAALNSNSNHPQHTTGPGPVTSKRSASDPDNNQITMDANGNQVFLSPQNGEMDNFDIDYTPELDYLNGDSGFDFENADLGGDMIGALPGRQCSSDDIYANAGDGHEKRKSRDDYDAEEGDAKRQETQEGEKSGAKKPGRKPLTNEPTTKRKAQNRAAQRAFRERKEQHLKDLETKVTELSKAQEADKHENGLLKAQVERLQTELREYRKRLSSSGAVGRSPPLSAVNAQQRSASGSSYNGNFNFNFPKFGGLPGSQVFGSSGLSPLIKQDSTSPPALQAPTRTSSSLSPKENDLITPPTTNSPSQYASNNMPFAPYSTDNNMHGFASTLPQMTGGSDPFGDLFSPSILKSANHQDYFKNNSSTATQPAPSTSSNIDNGGDSTAGLNRVFQFNSGSNASDTTSPSASSQSQWNMNGTCNSSCGTSPEPSHNSPANKDNQADSFSQKQYQDNANLANFNTNSQQSGMNSLDYNVPSLGSFDPVLFGDYRESNNAIVGGGDFTGGFFDDALNSAPFDFASPSNLFGILQSPQQSNANLNTNNRTPKDTAPSAALMAQIEKARDGGDDDFGLPPQPQQAATPKTSGQFISCNNIWNQLQSNPDFQSGKFDLESLCSELRTKAKCSESGVMVDKKVVDEAFRKLGKKDETGAPWAPEGLLFDNDSWDKAYKQLGGGK
ncbi:unnamed protein product [Zymoseptoria tritici ST99CH_3D1]|nr:unnamed protein product [Zymoseptoria tritici ST99CH_3D1]